MNVRQMTSGRVLAGLIAASMVAVAMAALAVLVMARPARPVAFVSEQRQRVEVLHLGAGYEVCFGRGSETAVCWTAEALMQPGGGK